MQIGLKALLAGRALTRIQGRRAVVGGRGGKEAKERWRRKICG